MMDKNFFFFSYFQAADDRLEQIRLQLEAMRSIPVKTKFGVSVSAVTTTSEPDIDSQCITLSTYNTSDTTSESIVPTPLIFFKKHKNKQTKKKERKNHPTGFHNAFLFSFLFSFSLSLSFSLLLLSSLLFSSQPTLPPYQTPSLIQTFLNFILSIFSLSIEQENLVAYRIKYV